MSGDLCGGASASPVRIRVPARRTGCARLDAACSNERFDGQCVSEVTHLPGGILRFFPPAARLIRNGRASSAIEIETVCVGRRAYALALAVLRSGDAASYEARLRAAMPPGAKLREALSALRARQMPREDAWCLWHDATVYFAVDASFAEVGPLRGLLARLLPSGLAAVIRSKGGALTAAALTGLATRLGVALVSSTLVATASHATAAYLELLRTSGLLPPQLVGVLSGGEGGSGGFRQVLDFVAQSTVGVSPNVRSMLTRLLMRIVLPCVVTAIAYSLDFARGVTERRRWALAESVLVVARESLDPGSAKTLPLAFLRKATHLADRQSRSMLTSLGLPFASTPSGAADPAIVLELQKLRDAPGAGGGGSLATEVLVGLARAVPGLISSVLGATSATAATLNMVTAVPLLLYDVWSQARDAVSPEVILARAAGGSRADEDAAATRRAALIARADLRLALAQHFRATGKSGDVKGLLLGIGCEYAGATQRLQKALELDNDDDDELDSGEDEGEGGVGSSQAAQAALEKKKQLAREAEAKVEELLAEFGHAGAASSEWPTFQQVELASRLLRAKP